MQVLCSVVVECSPKFRDNGGSIPRAESCEFYFQTSSRLDTKSLWCICMLDTQFCKMVNAWTLIICYSEVKQETACWCPIRKIPPNNSIKLTTLKNSHILSAQNYLPTCCFRIRKTSGNPSQTHNTHSSETIIFTLGTKHIPHNFPAFINSLWNSSEEFSLGVCVVQ